MFFLFNNRANDRSFYRSSFFLSEYIAAGFVLRPKLCCSQFTKTNVPATETAEGACFVRFRELLWFQSDKVSCISHASSTCRHWSRNTPNTFHCLSPLSLKKSSTVTQSPSTCVLTFCTSDTNDSAFRHLLCCFTLYFMRSCFKPWTEREMTPK